MAYSGNLPGHITAMARTAFLMEPAVPLPQDYKLFTREVPLNLATTTLTDLGGNPRPSRNPYVAGDLVERLQTITPEDWYMSVFISQNAIDDDQTGEIKTKFQQVVSGFYTDINDQAFIRLNEGDTTTYGVSITGLSLFNDSHIYKGGKNTTAQDNKFALTLSVPNYATVWGAARLFKDDHGNFYNYNYNLIVTDPLSIQAASDIANNLENASTANRSKNPFAGVTNFITNPNISAGEWYGIASGAMNKPIIFGMRKPPTLMTDYPRFEKGPNGGTWEFAYHGRYAWVYGDPLLAFKGN